MNQGPLSVLQYGDFRSFLKEHLASRKRRQSGFGLAAWAKQLGLRSHSALAMILNGQRNPGPHLVEGLIRDLKLTAKEAAFFRDLVLFEKCREGSETEGAIKQRLAQQHPRKNFRELNAETFQAVSNWYYYAIRELVDLADFREDAEWIQRRLQNRVTKKQITAALQTLVNLKLLERDAEGRLRYPSFATSTFDVPDTGLKKFHQQILSIAQDSLHTVPVPLRDISGGTITLKKGDIERAKAILRQALLDVAALGQAGGDEVYHVETLLFPLTKKGIIQ